MKTYITYPVQAVEFDGDDGAGVEDLAALLREVADKLDGHQEHMRTRLADNITYDLAITRTDDGLYKAMLYVFNDEGYNDASRSGAGRSLPNAGVDGLRSWLHAPGGEADMESHDGLCVDGVQWRTGAHTLVCRRGAPPKQSDCHRYIEGSCRKGVAVGQQPAPNAARHRGP